MTLAVSSIWLQVLRLLTWAYVELGDKPAQALNCIQALKKQAAEGSTHPTMCFLTLKALCSLGRHQEAETELLQLVSSTDIKLDLCLSAMKVMLDGPGKQQHKPDGGSLLPAVKSALGLIQECFADQARVPVQLVKLLLAQEQVCVAMQTVTDQVWQVFANACPASLLACMHVKGLHVADQASASRGSAHNTNVTLQSYRAAAVAGVRRS